MRFIETKVAGAWEIEIEPLSDERGFFARAFCAETFAARGLMDRFVHADISFNPSRGTLRGMHLQAPPRAEIKLVRAVRGRIFDVAVDLRPQSPTYLGHAAVELDASRWNALYVPAGCAHGFLTLEDDCEVLYLVSEIYARDLARTFRWNDPAFGVNWPAEPQIISARDANAEDFKP
ncbi:dTDP-4-dehydrorhamnose 3,5-epimerase [Aurantimonas sp. C2-6-R+9]|uniref:dTDP-4-dehydrorhamnose 3,5-epimerase n=1 Tax=unclassified Aurantimonas TaxID=2638230 RepID=UPI002E16EC9B|nr:MULTISPECIES: dTDP-4-dehydrorhamnose 3,5-epimerase [unclassified Aurantimonas]MEC5291200.1 dTDP-4-dehydrorhamnose 3,5-epimerase [Aurantimonas sp. C2-3-R2]MEC5380981.1 dTDP-4-dehydrorhamnose 3,5-epimerase [Aurantimonas sp. C2-6-R+9]MEC5412309.1 dTDP-4-dehydrorhamnose 3,5-epimerase [Aurantimonas sp. C2-4-R8]